MAKQTELIPSFPDVRALFGLSPEALGHAERAYRTWCETAGDIQSHATQFLNSRLAKDYAAIARFRQCRTPVEVFNAQMDYANNAFADLVDEGQKVVAYFGNMATEGVLHGPTEQLRSVPKSKMAGKNRRPPHRVGGH
jgi:hypothetical protein